MAEYHVENFGCRASRSDGESIGANLRQSGLLPAAAPDSADVVIVNTCSVTAEADRQARAYLRRVRRQNPGARVIVTGCYAQRAPQEIAALPEVDAVIGNSHKSLVAEIALGLASRNKSVVLSAASELQHASSARAEAIQTQVEEPALDLPAEIQSNPTFVPLARILHDDAFAHTELATLPFAPDARQTRPNLKVQDGCGNRCSFCIIPTTRGPSRSIPLATCLDNVRRFVDNGGQELVVSGINLGRWGRDLNPAQRFEDLIAAILTETSLPRLRLSSIEPMDWSPDLLALYREFSAGEDCSPNASLQPVTRNLQPVTCNLQPRLCRHAHLPLQSGSDTILRRMHRRYRPWHYAERLSSIRALLPDAAIGADVMIGFPGETDALFEESYQFIAAQPFTYLHLFPFSARPHTPAWELHRQNPVPTRAVQERMAALRALMAEKSHTFRSSFLGRTLSAVTVEPGLNGTTEAVTDNFLKLTLAPQNAQSIPANRLVTARITHLTPEGLAGIAI
ncbi:MAG TPA: radical SAM protein [Acidobacteriaceae bacterium]|nr:radical SAM protein [Acidobacteriaceae bacterium]